MMSPEISKVKYEKKKKQNGVFFPSSGWSFLPIELFTQNESVTGAVLSHLSLGAIVHENPT